MSRAIFIVNLFLGIVIIALLAGLATESLSTRLGSKFPLKSVTTAAPSSAAPRAEVLSFYAPILTEGLFGKATQGPLAPITSASASAQATSATAPSELMLLGTAVGSFRETFALVRNMTKQEERVFRLGDMVFDAGRLVGVSKDKAFIVINGKKVELLTPFTPPPSSSPAPAPAPAAASGTAQPGVAVANMGSGNYVIDQRALNAALDNPAQAMSDARLLPSQKDGKVEGFRASEVKPNGVFGMLGIKNGDILVSLNDFPMDSPDKALQSFIALKGQNHLKLDVIRDGQPQTLNYDIR
ncbi:MAG: type II secretion system protein GspC [Desulfuromonadaceae bacterium]|nr:type II secretion system protein GspC [Desulfuromonadaceae bacterium]